MIMTSLKRGNCSEDTQNYASTSKDCSSEYLREKSSQARPRQKNTIIESQEAYPRVYIKDNRKLLSQEDAVHLHNEILKSISSYDEGIHFLHCMTKAGCIIVTCDNEQSRDWLDKQIPTLEPWDGAQLTIINEIDLIAQTNQQSWVVEDNLDPHLQNRWNYTEISEQEPKQTKSNNSGFYDFSLVDTGMPIDTIITNRLELYQDFDQTYLDSIKEPNTNEISTNVSFENLHTVSVENLDESMNNTLSVKQIIKKKKKRKKSKNTTFSEYLKAFSDAQMNNILPAEQQKEKINNKTNINKESTNANLYQEINTTESLCPPMIKTSSNETMNNALSNEIMNNALSNETMNNALSNGTMNNALSNGTMNNALSNGTMNNALFSEAIASKTALNWSISSGYTTIDSQLNHSLGIKQETNQISIKSSNKKKTEALLTSEGVKRRSKPRGIRAGKLVKKLSLATEPNISLELNINLIEKSLAIPNSYPTDDDVSKAKTGTNKSLPTDSCKNNELSVAIMVMPLNDLTEKQAKEILKALERKFENDLLSPKTTNVTSRLRYRGKPHYNQGVLKIWCESKFSVKWLRWAVGSLQSPIPNTKLVVKPQSVLQRKILCSLFVPEVCRDIEKLRKLLAAQNQLVNINAWSIVKSERVMDRNPPGIFLLFRVPVPDVIKLKKAERRLYWLMGNIYIRILGEKDVASK